MWIVSIWPQNRQPGIVPKKQRITTVVKHAVLGVKNDRLLPAILL